MPPFSFPFSLSLSSTRTDPTLYDLSLSRYRASQDREQNTLTRIENRDGPEATQNDAGDAAGRKRYVPIDASSAVTYRAEALRLAVIDIVFLVMLLGTYLYIELAEIPVGRLTYTIIQLTAIVIVGTLAIIGGFVYFIEN